MPPTADIATPDRFRHPSLLWLLTPILLVAAWTIAEPRHVAVPQSPAGLAAER